MAHAVPIRKGLGGVGQRHPCLRRPRVGPTGKRTTFGTGRKVHNVVDSRFDFADGLIIRHTDDFNFDKWAAQAFGLPGKIVGYVPVLPEFSMQRLAGLQLKRFQDSRRK